jgi:hypothetical protein
LLSSINFTWNLRKLDIRKATMRLKMYAKVMIMAFLSSGLEADIVWLSNPHFIVVTKSGPAKIAVKYVITKTYTKSSIKYFLFQNPTQLLIHGQ